MMLMGQRLTMRPLERADLNRSRVWVNDPANAAPLLRSLPVSELEQERWFEAICTDSRRMVWAALLESEHVGNAGLYHVDLLHRRAEAWFLLGDPQKRGKGLGKEMAGLIMGYGFNSLGLNKIYLHVGVDNQVALRLYQRLGFLREGELKQEYFINGAFRDVWRMAILSQDWRQRTSGGRP